MFLLTKFCWRLIFVTLTSAAVFSTNRERAIRLFFRKWRLFLTLEVGGRFTPHLIQNIYPSILKVYESVRLD